MEEVRSASYVSVVANNLIASFKEPFLLEQKEYQVSVSIGVSMSLMDAHEEAVLMRHADVAMYRAKNQGRNTVCFFSQELEAELMKRHELELLLRETLDADALTVFFQPQIAIDSGRVCGFEALVRLKEKSGALVAPQEFISLAEELGLIDELGEQVLQKSCAFGRRLLDQGVTLKVSVNVSSQQLKHALFVDQVARCLEKHKLPSRQLELEVTESALVESFEQVQCKLAELADMGVTIAIDDFGTGYSSLSYLKVFPLDVLKIDKSFIQDMGTGEHHLGIVQTIVLLARSLGLKLVAEGVETDSQVSELKSLKCDVAQGYFYARPMDSQSAFSYALLHSLGKDQV